MSGQVITASTAVRDSSATLTMSAAQDVNNVSYASNQDEKIFIVVQNANDAVAVETATITISPGDGAAWRHDLATLTVQVADASTKTVIGPLDSARFKNSAGYVVVNAAITQGGTLTSVTLGAILAP